jgi:hypothetical protein
MLFSYFISFDTFEFEYDTHKCDYDTHKCDFDTLESVLGWSNLNTHERYFNVQSEISSRTV